MDILREINQQPVLKLNQLPVPTWRWLKVNDYSLKDFYLTNISPYEKNSLKVLPKEGVEIYPLDGSNEFVHGKEFFSSKDFTGVSQEFVSLAEKYANTGSIIHVHKNMKIKEPLWLSYEADVNNPILMDHHRILAEEDSEITIVMDYSSTTSAFHNGLTKIHAKAGAVVHLIKIQNLHDDSLNLDSHGVSIENDGQVNYVSIEMGSKQSIVSYVADLKEEDSRSDLCSIYLVDGQRTLDLNYIMNHMGRESISNIRTYGALMEHGKKIFRGTLDFKQGASHAKGSEEEFVILLDKTVKNISIPLLLCKEDDVEGLHAASAGQIDEDKLFYIMSRGLTEQEAKRLIIESYFNPILDKIPMEALKEKVRLALGQRLLKKEGEN